MTQNNSQKDVRLKYSQLLKASLKPLNTYNVIHLRPKYISVHIFSINREQQKCDKYDFFLFGMFNL